MHGWTGTPSNQNSLISVDPNMISILALRIINDLSFHLIDTQSHIIVPKTPEIRSNVLNSDPAPLNITEIKMKTVAAHLAYQSRFSGYQLSSIFLSFINPSVVSIQYVYYTTKRALCQALFIFLRSKILLYFAMPS